MLKKSGKLILIAALSIACSQVSVESGKNAQPPASNPPSIAGQKVTPQNQSDSKLTGKGTCFGSANKLPDFLSRFCTSLSESDKEMFASTHNLICVEKKLVNLFHPSCGAISQENREQFFRVIKTTELSDKSTTNFYYLSAYALNLEKVTTDYLSVVKLAYTDSAAFSSKYVYPKNTTVTPDGMGIQSAGDREIIGFQVEVNALQKTSFGGRMEILSLGDDLTVILNRADKDLMNINFRKNVSFIYRPDSQFEKIVTIEEREVPDKGLHQVAFSTLRGIDLDEMAMRLENAERSRVR